MSHLSTVYAKDMGVKKGHPVLIPHYIPLIYEKYITIHTSDKVPAKNYSYWHQVVQILKNNLNDIKIVQVGASNDPRIEGVDYFYNYTTFKQSCFVIQNALLHVGIDSSPVHIASSFNIPTVSVYGHTYAQTCNPLWNDQYVLLEPDWSKRCPSFQNAEHPKQIDSIMPETIANNCLQLLEIKHISSQETLYIGDKFLHKTIDCIINAEFKEKVSNTKVRIRADIHYNPDDLNSFLTSSPNNCEIICNGPLDSYILERHKSKIDKIIYKTNLFDPEFVKILKKINLHFELICDNVEYLAEERSKYFDYNIQDGSKDINHLDIERLIKYKQLKVETGKIYHSQNGKQLSLAENHHGKDFWQDMEYFRFYIDKT